MSVVSFEEFAVARSAALLRYATTLTCDRDLAQDIVQEVLIRLHARWRRVQQLDRPDAYAKRAITNEFLSWRRRRSVRSVRVGAVPEVSLPDPAEASAERSEVWARLADLPPRQRAVLALRYYEGLDDAEIAEILGCAPVTVRSYASRGLATLRDRLTARLPVGGHR